MQKTLIKSGFVALLGRPNVGKSTLLNCLLGSKVSIISSVPQTTRYQIRGILNLTASGENLGKAQIVFVDTPGIHSFRDALTKHLNTIATHALQGCDLLLYVVDTSRSIGREEERIVILLSSQPVKTVMVLNKIDLGAQYLDEYVALWEEKTKGSTNSPLTYYLPVSAKTGKNIDVLKSILVEQLPQQMPFYPQDTVTDFPLKFRVADIIREKLFLNLKKELPHSLAVLIEDWKDKKTLLSIRAMIYVNRASQKRIVIGQAGTMIKRVGVASRKEIEAIVGKKVFLDIWAKVLEDWQERRRVLKELGYWWM